MDLYNTKAKLFPCFTSSEGDPQEAIYNTDIKSTPFPLLQYNLKWKKPYFEKEMGL